MIIYSKNEKYKIWVDTDTRKFYIQMTDSELQEDGFDTAVLAIIEAEK